MPPSQKSRWFDRRPKQTTWVINHNDIEEVVTRLEPQSLHDDRTGDRFVIETRPFNLKPRRGRRRQIYLASAQTGTTLQAPAKEGKVLVDGKEFDSNSREIGILLEANDLYALHNSVKETNWLIVILALLGGIGLGYILSMAYDAFGPTSGVWGDSTLPPPAQAGLLFVAAVRTRHALMRGEA